MRTTTPFSELEYIGNFHDIALYRNGDTVFAFKRHPDTVMATCMDTHLTQLAEQVLKLQHDDSEESVEMECETKCEVLHVMLKMMEEKGSSWQMVRGPDEWLEIYLNLLSHNQKLTQHLWSSFESYEKGFESFREEILGSGLRPTLFDEFPSETHLREHYMKRVGQKRRH